jgi:hypothetical protein
MGRYGGISVKNEFVIFLMVIALIQGAYGIQITASGGGNGESGSVSMNFDTLASSAVRSQIAINNADITPSTAISGPIAKFEQTHAVKDASGKSSSVYVKVLNAPSGLTYTSKVLPKEGSVTTRTQVSAEQWLTVPKADSIKCTATSSYGTTRLASVGLEEAKGTLAGDYVTLTGYYGKALTTGTSVLASQTATSGAANSIKIYGTAKDSSGTYKVDTPIKGISSGKATFAGLSETSSAGTTAQVVQTEHVHGTFTSTAAYAPITGIAQAKTRTSNYGTEYDINMKTAKGSLPTGILGYYVKPGTTASKIQGAVNAAALSGDTINVAAGTYKENVQIDKSLALKGAGSTKTIVDGNKAGSVFTVGKNNPNIDVTLANMAITGGSGSLIKTKYGTTDICGGGVLNLGNKLTVTDSIIQGNTAKFLGGGIYNVGTLNVLKSTISGNTAGYGGGFYNYGATTVQASTISKNVAINMGGGSYSCCSSTTTLIDSKVLENAAKGTGGGGGIATQGTFYIKGASTISGNTAKTGGGIRWLNNRPIIDATTIITGNSNPQIYPY